MGPRLRMTEMEEVMDISSNIYELKLPVKNKKPVWPESSFYVPAVSKNGDTIRIPVLPRTNVLVTGVVGTGKTSFTKKYVRALLCENPDMPAVFFEIKKDDYTDAFYEDGDKVITYDENAFNGSGVFRWNMIREIRQGRNVDTETEELASSLFQDLIQGSQNHLIWANAAKATFAGILQTVIHCYRDSPSNRLLIGRIRSMTHKELLEFIAKYPPNQTMLKNNFEYDPANSEGYIMPRKGTDTMFFFDYVLQRFGGCFLSDGNDTIHDFLHGEYGRRLFFNHDFAMAESIQMFERYFLRKIITEKLSSSSGLYGQPLLMVLDEADKIGYDFGLFNAVTLGRQFGLQCVLSTQSVCNLYSIAPEKHAEHITRASLSGFPVLVTFRPGDTSTIENLQSLFGDTDRAKTTMGLSRSERPETVIVTEPIVTAEMLQSLGLGECYVKVREAAPVRCKITKTS